ncbi:phosphoethanolamine transferase [Solimonas soli]|uniref:phosphoethanolamine transferase n=1 Tax=Solimonas soli TaxID=413479 RepID=UPI0004B5072C|nr:phosphoethanolamine--lipid A transferase [Solimonas soli]
MRLALPMSRAGAAPRLPALPGYALSTAAALFITRFDNDRLWRRLHALLGDDAHALLLRTSTALVMVAVYVALFSLCGGRRTLKPALAIALAFSAATAYFIDRFGTVIDAGMIRNVFETDTREAGELLTADFAWYLCGRALLPITLLIAWPLAEGGGRVRRLLVAGAWSALLLASAVTALLTQFKDFAIIGREHRELAHLFNPFFPAQSLLKYAGSQVPRAALPVDPLGRDATRPAPPAGAHPQVVVLVLGETARAADFGIDGYVRDTTPHLAALDDLLNFGRATSCGTATAQSVPCMFSLLGRARWKPAPDAQYLNVLDVLAHTGVDAHWRDNDGGCKGVCGSAETVDVTKHGPADLCDAAGCHDDILLADLPALLDAARRDTLIVLHQIGSHGPAYARRYPAAYRRYLPACESAQPQNCAHDELVNAYDNTIVYTDHILDAVLDALRARGERLDAAMIYLSDHGESLGENGLYLHGFPYALAPIEQKQVPFVAWLSPELQKRQALRMDCARQQARKPHSQDDLAPLLLGLFGVRSAAYRADLDPLAACRA